MKKLALRCLQLLIIATVTLTTTPNYMGKAAAKPISISGSSTLNAQQMGDWVLLNNPAPRLTNISIYQLADLFLVTGRLEGIRGDIAFAQAIHETGYFKYGGDVLPSQNNYAGIGAVGGGAKGATFATPEEGVRAQIQHLKAYANTDPLATVKVDPRFDYVKRGIAPNWIDLNGKWAVPGVGYGEKILTIYESMKSISVTIPNVDLSVTHKIPVASVYLKADRPMYAPDGTVHQILKKGFSYRIYGVLGNNYNLGANYVIAADSAKMNVFVGRTLISKTDGMLYAPNGKPYRKLVRGEAPKVYSYDDTNFYVGAGYYIKKTADTKFYKGIAKIIKDVPMYAPNGTIYKTLKAGDQVRVYNTSGSKYDIGGGYYLLNDKAKINYLFY